MNATEYVAEQPLRYLAEWYRGTERTGPAGPQRKQKREAFTLLNAGRKPYSCASGPAMSQTGGGCQRSRIAATPIPPAVQIEISPRPEPRSASCLAGSATMRAPEVSNGCPPATLQP